jgi:prepilin-type N-terminal cleavage/methylation domain-containing protein
MMKISGVGCQVSDYLKDCSRFTVHGSRFTERGFTLIETIIVMVIMAILAAVVAVRWSPFDTIKLNNATRKVAADIRYAQKLAISSQISTQTKAAIEFNANGYCVFNDVTLRTGVCAPASALTKSPGDPCSTDSSNYFIVAFNDSRCETYSGVTITTDLTNNIVRFNSLGTPFDDTGVVINIDKTVTVTYNGTKQITIGTGTGRVSIQ